MADTTSDLQSKINRAVRAVLIDVGAGTPEQTIAAPSSVSRSLPNTAIITGDGVPFDGPGNWQFPNVTLMLRDDAVVQPGEANPAATKTSANERLSAIFNALMRSDDEHTLKFTALELTAKGRALAESDGSEAGNQRAEDNADMADFTVLWWDFGSIGTATKSEVEGETFWERELNFSCVACNASFD